MSADNVSVNLPWSVGFSVSPGVVEYVGPGLATVPRALAVAMKWPIVDDATAQPVPDVAADDLTVIKGIGKAKVVELNANGIHTYADLAAANIDELHSRTGISVAQLDAWLEAAKELAK